MLEFVSAGYMGKDRDRIIRSFYKRAGKGNWFWAFRAGKRLYSWELGMQLYEDAYWNFFRKNVGRLKELVENYYDVMVYERDDLDAKLSYKDRQKSKDYFQDIAIRRSLIRMGVWFKGKEILKISKSRFNDGKIPFHLPNLIRTPDASKSTRSWLDSNRMIVIAREVSDKHELAEILVK